MAIFHFSAYLSFLCTVGLILNFPVVHASEEAIFESYTLDFRNHTSLHESIFSYVQSFPDSNCDVNEITINYFTVRVNRRASEGMCDVTFLSNDIRVQMSVDAIVEFSPESSSTIEIYVNTSGHTMHKDSTFKFKTSMAGEQLVIGSVYPETSIYTIPYEISDGEVLNIVASWVFD